MPADASAAVIRRFVRKRGPVLARALPTGKLILDFYAEEVISTEEKRYLQGKRDNDKLSDPELMELLLDMLDEKSTNELVGFVNVVRENKEHLEKVSSAAVDDLSGLVTVIKPAPAPEPSAEVAPPQINGEVLGLPVVDGKPPTVIEIPITKTKVSEKVIMSISDRFATIHDCRRLAVHLELRRGGDLVESILSGNHRARSDEVAHAVLTQWVKEKGSAAVGEVLLDVLQNKLNLTEIADDFYKDLCSKDKPLKRTILTHHVSAEVSSNLPSFRGVTSATFWEDLLRPYYTDLRRRLGSSGEIRAMCYSEGLITMEEQEILATQTNHFQHNETLLTILCRNSADKFPAFLKVLRTIGRYSELVAALEMRYRHLISLESQFR